MSFAENPAIRRLQQERAEHQQRADECDRQIGELIRACAHERDDWPNAWWCRKCGGEMPKPIAVNDGSLDPFKLPAGPVDLIDVPKESP